MMKEDLIRNLKKMEEEEKNGGGLVIPSYISFITAPTLVSSKVR